MENIESLKMRIVDETRIWYQLACEEYNIPYAELTVKFTLTGRTAGQAFIQKHEVNYNLNIAGLQADSFIARTIPHEVAHIVQHKLYPRCKRHHGIEWESVMRKFNVPAVRCHSYNVPTLQGNRQYFKYKCSDKCGLIFTVGKLVHTKIQNGDSRRCTKCKTVVTLL